MTPLGSIAIALPTADRQASYRFYREGLGLEPIGEPAEDGVPEPSQFAVNSGVRLMLIPTGGFDWIIGDREVAAPGHSECVVDLGVETAGGVDDVLARARAAGADIITEPGRQPWGYAGAFADLDGHVWMVTAQVPGDAA